MDIGRTYLEFVVRQGDLSVCSIREVGSHDRAGQEVRNCGDGLKRGCGARVSLLMSAPLSSPRAEFLSFTTNHIPVERTRKTEKNTQMADSGGKSRIIPLHPLVFTGSHKSQFVLSQRR